MKAAKNMKWMIRVELEDGRIFEKEVYDWLGGHIGIEIKMLKSISLKLYGSKIKRIVERWQEPI